MSKKSSKCPAHDRVSIVETKKGPVVRGGTENVRKKWQERLDRWQKLYDERSNNAAQTN